MAKNKNPNNLPAEVRATATQEMLNAAKLATMETDSRDKKLTKSITQSLKLTKNVLLKQLRNRVTEIRKEMSTISDEQQKYRFSRHYTNDNSEKTKSVIALFKELQVKTLSTSKELTAIRKAINAFLPKGSSMLDNTALIPENAGFTEFLEKLKLKEYRAKGWGKKKIRFNTRAQFNNFARKRSTVEGDYLHIEVAHSDLPKPILNYIEEKYCLHEKREELQKEVVMVEYKISNIGEVMEDLEAKMLTQHLSGSDEGTEVLEMANTLINNHLGDTGSVALLEKK